MGHRFAEIAFTESVRAVQQEQGSLAGYSTVNTGEDHHHILSAHEAEFITARDSFYMASVSETGWPYVQHRGGPAGFVRIVDECTVGFADFSGNRQYVSVGNFMKNDRVALFFMDYPNRTRLKLLGRVQLIGPEQAVLLTELEIDDYKSRVERGFLIHVEAFDWNCPQHITPRYTESQIKELLAPLIDVNRVLTAFQADDNNVRLQALGDGPLELVISGVRQLTPRIRAYELRDPQGAELPVVEAGAHLQVPVQLANGRAAIRHYSICSNPKRRDIYEIAVLREDDGTGGSRAAHQSFDIGLRLHCALPQNQFPLHADMRPAVLIAGGIGITPIKAMAETLNNREGILHLHYAGRSEQEMAFRDQLINEFGDALTLYSSAAGERMDIAEILSAAPDGAVFYVCGPDRLIRDVYQAASDLNIDFEQIRSERFSAVVDPGAQPLLIDLRRSGKQLQVAADQSILDAMLEAGVDAPFSCNAGVCKTCAVKVLEGVPDHRDFALSEAEREEYSLMCPCVSRAAGDHLVLDV